MTFITHSQPQVIDLSLQRGFLPVRENKNKLITCSNQVNIIGLITGICSNLP